MTLLQAIDALKEIFLVALLPDRKLRFFEQQPLAAVPDNKEGHRRLLFFHVEDCLKKRYTPSNAMHEPMSHLNGLSRPAYRAER